MKRFLSIIGVGVVLSVNVWPGQAASQLRTPPGAAAVSENRGNAPKPLLQNLSTPATPSKVAGGASQAASLSGVLSTPMAEILAKARGQAQSAPKSPPPFTGLINILPAIQPLAATNPCLISKVTVTQGLLGKAYKLEGCPVNYWTEMDTVAGEFVNYCYAQMCAEGSCGWIVMGMTDLQCNFLQNATASSLRISTSESISWGGSEDGKVHFLIPTGFGLGADLGDYLKSETEGAIQ